MTNPPVRAKGEYWLLVLVGVLALGLGLGAAVAKYVNPFPAATPELSAGPSPSAAAPSTPTLDPTASWATYSDTTDQFSLRYPPAWQHRTCVVNGHATLYLAPTS